MELYHGTNKSSYFNIKKNGILLSRCDEFTDFGRGFYLSREFGFAKHTALGNKRKAETKKREYEPIVIAFEFDDESFFNSELNYYEFPNVENLEWLQFIVTNRNGIRYANNISSDFHNIDAKYDLVTGRVADGNITELAEILRVRNVLASQTDIKSIKYSIPEATQHSFHSPEAFKFLKIKGYEEV